MSGVSNGAWCRVVTRIRDIDAFRLSLQGGILKKRLSPRQREEHGDALIFIPLSDSGPLDAVDQRQNHNEEEHLMNSSYASTSLQDFDQVPISSIP